MWPGLMSSEVMGNCTEMPRHPNELCCMAGLPAIYYNVKLHTDIGQGKSRRLRVGVLPMLQQHFMLSPSSFNLVGSWCSRMRCCRSSETGSRRLNVQLLLSYLPVRSSDSSRWMWIAPCSSRGHRCTLRAGTRKAG